MVKTSKYTYAVGRRKSATATVKLFTDSGTSTVNGKPSDKYFYTDRLQYHYKKPQKITKTASKFYFTAKVRGGGLVSQSQAVGLAIARCLDKFDSKTYRPLLKPEDLLTVDARVRQRRMIGTGGKARRQKQSPKR